MEAEVASMVLNMYNAPSTAGGFVTSGGTESLLMACKTYRDWGLVTKNISRPNMVVPDTIHAAFDKACEYFGIEMIKLPVDAVSFKADVSKMAKAINKNTVMIAGSGPNYPHGIVDDIEALGKLAKKHGIGMHVDCCLGGFLVPFMEDAGYPLPPFDFRVEGVTSISCDTHKYGFAPKGTSVVMYRDKELRKYQYTVMPDWTGGMYASHGIAGSRAGSVIAGAWASLLKMGREGYVETTRKIIEASRKLKEAIKEIPELKLIGDPLVSIVAWTSATDLNIYAIGDAMTKRGWHISSIQNPAGLHVAVTLLVSDAIDDLISNLKEAVEQVKQDPEGSKGAAVAVYGSTQGVPDARIVEDVLRGYLDAVYIAE
jgi:sphinganine-1-phosphate aldolase